MSQIQKLHAGQGQKPAFDCLLTDVASSIQDLAGLYWRATKDTCFKTLINIAFSSKNLIASLMMELFEETKIPM